MEQSHPPKTSSFRVTGRMAGDIIRLAQRRGCSVDVILREAWDLYQSVNQPAAAGSSGIGRGRQAPHDDDQVDLVTTESGEMPISMVAGPGSATKLNAPPVPEFVRLEMDALADAGSDADSHVLTSTSPPGSSSSSTNLSGKSSRISGRAPRATHAAESQPAARDTRTSAVQPLPAAIGGDADPGLAPDHILSDHPALPMNSRAGQPRDPARSGIHGDSSPRLDRPTPSKLRIAPVRLPDPPPAEPGDKVREPSSAGGKPGSGHAEGPANANPNVLPINDDDTLRAIVQNELNKFPIVGFSFLDVQVKKGRIIIEGTVGSSVEKVMLLQSVRRLVPSEKITDRIQVQDRRPAAPSSRLPDFLTQYEWGNSRYLMLQASAAVAMLGFIWFTVFPLKASERRLMTIPVSGNVVLDGKPLEGAIVTLNPLGNAALKQIRPRAKTGADGAFAIETYGNGDGAPIGRYAVTVIYCPMIETDEGPIRGKNVLHPRYSDPQTGMAVVQVAKGRPGLIPTLEVAR